MSPPPPPNLAGEAGTPRALPSLARPEEKPRGGGGRQPPGLDGAGLAERDRPRCHRRRGDMGTCCSRGKRAMAPGDFAAASVTVGWPVWPWPVSPCLTRRLSFPICKGPGNGRRGAGRPSGRLGHWGHGERDSCHPPAQPRPRRALAGPSALVPGSAGGWLPLRGRGEARRARREGREPSNKGRKMPKAGSWLQKERVRGDGVTAEGGTGSSLAPGLAPAALP